MIMDTRVIHIRVYSKGEILGLDCTSHSNVMSKPWRRTREAGRKRGMIVANEKGLKARMKSVVKMMIVGMRECTWER